jgi:hypothetical protein
MDLTPVLSAIGDLREDVGGLRADNRSVQRQLDDMKKLIEQHVAADNKVAARVTALEHDRTRVKTWIAAFSLIGASASSVALAFIRGWFPPHV